MLSNAYFLAKIRFDSAENEPAKNLQNFANLPILLSPRDGRRVAALAGRQLLELRRRRRLRAVEPQDLAEHTWPRLATRRPIGEISAKCCSFSAVSAPIFARKYAFCSIFQNLPDYQAEIFEMWQNFANVATFAKILLQFYENC